MTFCEEELIALCRKQENIYIYGAGNNASLIYHFMQLWEISIKGFLVTEILGNPEKLFGYSVITVDELSQQRSFLILVPVAENGKAFKEICVHLVDNGIKNVYFLTNRLLEGIKEKVVSVGAKNVFHADIYYYVENVPVERWHSIFAMQRNGIEYHWRFRNKTIEDQNIHSVLEMFPKRNALEEFEGQYGKYNVFRAVKSEESVQGKSFAVYMACSHVDKAGMHNSIPSWMIPIQVGAALTSRSICTVKDNVGENISERNKNYSECTALFWMWKNAPKVDYIGLCHYRRHFDLTENEIGLVAARGFDVLVTSPTFVNEAIGNFFAILTPKSDLMMLVKAIEKVQPEYAQTAKMFFDSRFFPPCNLFIMKYDLFQEYMRFVFSITFEIERYYDDMGFWRGDRYMGYIVECLMGIFLMENKERLKIGYTDMRFYS